MAQPPAKSKAPTLDELKELIARNNAVLAKQKVLEKKAKTINKASWEKSA